MKISEHFDSKEFGCKCCGLYIPNEELVSILEKAREHFKVPIVITSGTRCVKHNQFVGGAKNSQHILGTAADVQVVGVAPKEVYRYFDELYPDTYGIGLYDRWVHIDVREHRSRW